MLSLASCLLASVGAVLGILLVVLVVFGGILLDIFCWTHTPCPQCGKRVEPAAADEKDGESGSTCPCCGTWFSDATWAQAQRDADPDF